jgi:hypothetical protein
MRALTTILLAFVAAWSCTGADADGSQAKPGPGKAASGPRVERSTDKDGKVTESTYDEQGNVIVKKVSVGTPLEAVCTYSATGQLLSEQAPDGTRTLYQYETPASKVPQKAKVIGPDGKEREYKPGTTT